MEKVSTFKYLLNFRCNCSSLEAIPYNFYFYIKIFTNLEAK